MRLLVGEKTAPTVRSRAATAMSYMGAAGAPYAPVMHSLLEDADAGLRSAACRALGMMGEEGQKCAEAPHNRRHGDRIEGGGENVYLTF